MVLKIVEGKTKLLVYQGKITKKLPVFFNPEKEFDRTLSVLFLKSFKEVFGKKLIVLDLLCAGGARGIRLLNESNAVEELFLNDMNSNAIDLAKKNLRLNGLRARTSNSEANKFLINVKQYFDFIDIDPFGSCNPFLENSIRKLRNKGVIAVTVTDCGALYGTYPKAGLRKYHSITKKIPFSHELGLRVLAKHVIEKGAEQEVALKPILSHKTRHYFRMYFQARKGASRVDDLLKEIKFLAFNKETMSARLIEKNFCVKNKEILLGPLFAGTLQENKILNLMIKNSDDEKITRFLKVLLAENTVKSVGFFELPLIAKKLHKNVCKIDNLIKKLESKGFKASRTHISGQGIKTNAPIEEIIKCFN